MTQPVRVEFWTYDLLLAKLGSNMQIFGLFCCQTAVFTYVSLFNNELVRSSRKRRTLPSPLFNRFWQVKPMTQYCLIRSPQKPARRPRLLGIRNSKGHSWTWRRLPVLPVRLPCAWIISYCRQNMLATIASRWRERPLKAYWRKSILCCLCCGLITYLHSQDKKYVKVSDGPL